MYWYRAHHPKIAFFSREADFVVIILRQLQASLGGKQPQFVVKNDIIKKELKFAGEAIGFLVGSGKK